MSGTPGFMAHESMSVKPVRGAAAQDVVAAAMVLLLVCVKKELRSPNLFTNPVRKRACGNPLWCSQEREQSVDEMDRVHRCVDFFRKTTTNRVVRGSMIAHLCCSNHPASQVLTLVAVDCPLTQRPQALMKPNEWDRLKVLFHRAKNLGENVSAEMELFQVPKLVFIMFTRLVVLQLLDSLMS